MTYGVLAFAGCEPRAPVFSACLEEAESAEMLALRQVVDSLPQCIFWKDTGGTFFGCNLAGAQAIGLSHPEAIRGKTDFDFHGDATVAEYLRREDFLAMRNGMPIYRRLSRGSGPAESARWYETSKIALRGSRGEVTGLLISYEDVTERQRIEEELRASNEQLRQAKAELIEMNAMLGQGIRDAVAKASEQERVLLQQSRHAAMGEMIGNIAHQWRQPLTTLSLLLQNIQYDTGDGAIDQAALVQKLCPAFRLIDRMSSTIDDFRNFFRPADSDSQVDVGACVGDALRLMAASLENAGIAVTVTACDACRVAGRPNELGQVLLNLLANAKDALVAHRTADREIRIDVSRGDDGFVTLRERNNGGCIPPEQLNRIFDPYYTTKAQGTGVGLYMTRKIICEHFQGTIGCANCADGVEFVIRLPAVAASAG